MTEKIQTDKLLFLFRNQKSGYSIHNVFMPVVKRLHATWIEAPCERADLRSIWRNLKWVRRNASKEIRVFHMTGGPHYFMLAIPFRKSVLTIHDLVLLHQYKGIKRFFFKWLWFLLPIRCANVITCITDTVRNDLLKTIPVDPAKVVTIYNPIAPHFHYTEKPFNSQCPHILHVGTAWNKNLNRVIVALKDVTCELIIIGATNDETKKLLESNGTHYHLLTNLTNEELYHQYQQADIISFPSIFEGFGMPIIEGQATGRPVLTSNIAPMTEIANGSACLVDPYQTDSIREGFLQIINDAGYRQQLIVKGRENVKRFSIEQITQQYIDVYQKAYDHRI